MMFAAFAIKSYENTFMCESHLADNMMGDMTLNGMIT